MIETTPPSTVHSAQLVKDGVRLVQVAEHAVADDGCETAAVDGFGCLFAARLDEPDSALGFGGELGEPLPGLVEHRRRRIQQGDLVPGLGQGKGLVSCAAADVENCRGRRRQV